MTPECPIEKLRHECLISTPDQRKDGGVCVDQVHPRQSESAPTMSGRSPRRHNRRFIGVS